MPAKIPRGAKAKSHDALEMDLKISKGEVDISLSHSCTNTLSLMEGSP